MNSYLITGGTNQDRLNKAKDLIPNFENHPDFLLISASPSISIQQIRQVKQFLSFKPYRAKFKIVFIPKAEKLTFPAQNAFLKTLEEPPNNSLIILCCQNENQLLPTIISRCQLIKLAPKTEIKLDFKTINTKYSILKALLNSGAGKRLKLIEPYIKNREEAIKFCQEMIIVLRHKSILENIRIIKKIQKTLILLRLNINVKLALNNLAISQEDEKEFC